MPMMLKSDANQSQSPPPPSLEIPRTYEAQNGIYEISIVVPQKTKNRAYGLAIPFLGLYPMDSKSTHNRKKYLHAHAGCCSQDMDPT